MNQDEGRARARKAVRAELTARGWEPSTLARRARIGAETAADFVAGRRWPKLATQGKIERALRWRVGTIERIVDGDDPPPLGGDMSDMDALALVRGLSRDERADLQVRIIELVGNADDRALRAVESVLKLLADGSG